MKNSNQKSFYPNFKSYKSALFTLAYALIRQGYESQNAFLEARTAIQDHKDELKQVMIKTSTRKGWHSRIILGDWSFRKNTTKQGLMIMQDFSKILSGDRQWVSTYHLKEV